ncbi:ATPase [Promicromonospora sp. NPDC057488]|uniref:ATPase n=1 Tax=Promicromonospora sp. NPDC057488 TaxID=3346147 RepID=UPI00366C6A67
MSSDTVPRWPRIDAIVREDGSGEVTIDGTFHPIVAGSLEEARVEVLRRVTENAVQIGRPVRASATGPEGLWNLIVHPDGTVVPEEDELAPPSSPTPQAPPAAAPPAAAPPAVAPQEPTTGPGTIPAPAFEGVPVADLPPGGDAEPADPIDTDTVRRAPRTPELPDAAQAPSDLALGGPAQGDLPTIPVPSGDAAADGDAGVADWVRESAAQDGPGNGANGSNGAHGGIPAAIPGSVASPVSAPVNAVPTADYGEPDGGLSDPASAPVPAGEPSAPRSRREARQSFLTHQQDEDPATQGFRGVLTRMGIRVGPSESERAERADERAVSQHWPGPRTISMVNGKGGAGKTPSTVLLAAVFAQFGGAGVVTWDNNQTRGTLGWRTEQGPHESTLLDLLPQTDRLLGPSAQAADLARYVHHQTRDRFDVLRSKPIAMANEQRIEPQDVDAIHSVLSKYYRMILIDSGNDESDPMWQRMIDLTDQLVVATTTRDDHAEAGALLLEALGTRDGRSAYLAQQAVVVVSQADQKESSGELEKVADGYRSLAREVVTIPFDPAMVDGHLRYGALRPETRRAWLAAGAAVAGGL